MSGYFDQLLDSYLPAAPQPAAADPWLDSAYFVPSSDERIELAPSRGEADLDRNPHVAIVPTEDLRDAGQSTAPANASDVADPSTRSTPVLPQERIVEHEIRIVEHIAAAEERAVLPVEMAGSSFEPASPGDVPIVRHETHLHEVSSSVEEHLHVAHGEAAPTDAQPDRAEIPLQMTNDNGFGLEMEAMADDLARALTRLDGLEGAATPFSSPALFEPESIDTAYPPEIETLREVTRDLVTEIHHHHHHHAAAQQPQQQPSIRPAPRTAEEVSRIGPIRFASAWKTGAR